MAQRRLGEIFTSEPNFLDLKSAFYWYQKAAMSGDVTAIDRYAQLVKDMGGVGNLELSLKWSYILSLKIPPEFDSAKKNFSRILSLESAIGNERSIKIMKESVVSLWKIGCASGLDYCLLKKQDVLSSLTSEASASAVSMGCSN